MDTSGGPEKVAGKPAERRGWLSSVAMIVIFDVAAPLAAYNLLRSAGLTAVAALLLSGVFPVIGVTIVAIRTRRLDVMGSLVLAGIVLGTALGLATHSPRLVLVEGSVPTSVFGVACLGSLWGSRRPLMFSLFREMIGPDTARGREMARLWNHEPALRRDVRVITAVWGAGFLIEAALRVIIVYNVSTGTALAISKVTPFLFGGIMSAWTLVYGAYRKKQSVRIATARAAQAARSSQDQPT